MKFTNLLKKFLFLMLIFTIEINSISSKIGPIDNQSSNMLKKNSKKNVVNQFRFESIEKNDRKKKDENILILNSEILNAKPPSDKEEEETQVFPRAANAGTEFRWKFLWWTLMYFPASNALSNGSSYWLSNRNVNQDHWEAVFEVPQKLDIIEIHWRLPPKRFRVFIRLDDKSDYIPVTDVFEKTSFINSEGKISNVDAITEYNAVMFSKPVFAKRVRINLNDPVRQHSFSIFTVKFFQKKTTMIIKNELVDETQHYCLFINTNLPRENTKVEAYSCVPALALSDNNELWIYNNDISVRHYNSKYCLGFDLENKLVLRKCDDYNPAFTIQFRKDNTMFFTGYEDKCIVLDGEKRSTNFITADTEIIVTSQADDESYKKENIKITGETYWYSAPGQKKATLQILFGKITSGPLKGKFETIKIDLIKIYWIRAPKKFMVYIWKPGYSWQLLQVYENYNNEISEIEVIGEKASAIMLVLEEAHKYEELGNLTTYAIKEVSISSNSISIKNANCGDAATKFKIFDFDTQSYLKLENRKAYESIRKKLSVSFEKNISNFTNLKRTFPYLKKAKQKSEDLTNKISNMKEIITDKSLKKLTDFKSTELTTIKNSMFEKFLNLYNKDFINSIKNNKSGEDRLGTKDLPAIDCLSIKKLQKNTLSGWYYIKPECSPRPLRVYCDFTIYGTATDIYVFNNDSRESNPDLSYLKIKDANSVRYQCAKLGLRPININNAATVERIYQILTAIGYNLSEAITIPLGYDYTCKNGKCSGFVNSFNDRQTVPIQSFFADSGKEDRGGLIIKPGPFAGFGYSETHKILKFDPSSVKISGLICSTNHFQTGPQDFEVKKVSCEMSPSSDGNIFSQGGTILVECPPSCQDASREVFGTKIYHLKSSICKAALHSGTINSFGGKVNVRISKPMSKYTGSLSNGIKSEDFDKKDGMNSFSLLKYNLNCPINEFKQLEKTAVSEPLSSFLQTASEIQYKQAREKFAADLNSNELEGVDFNDISKAGIKANSANFDFNKPDNDSEDLEYNKSHSSIDNNNNIETNNEEERISNEQPAEKNNDMIKFSEIETEVNKFNLAENSNNLRDRLVSEDPNSKKTEETMKNMFNSIQKATDNVMEMSKNATPVADVEKAAQENNNANSNIPDSSPDSNNINNPTEQNQNQDASTPVPPPDNKLPEAPKPPSPPDDEPKKKTNQRKEPSTDEGNKLVTKIRKVVDYEYLNTVKEKGEKVKKMIEKYQKDFAWSKDGSKYSNSYMKTNLALVDKYKIEVLYIANKLGELSKARVEKTKKLKKNWLELLYKAESKDIFKLDYSINPNYLFKEILVAIDTKSPIKPNWAIVKEGIKDKARAIGITSKISSNSQLIASVLTVNGKDYFDFKLHVDILLKSTGKVGIIFRMINEYNFYAFSIDKQKGVKEIVKVVNGRTVVLKKITDGGILINNWHRVNIKVVADNIRVFIYDAEQPNKTASEKILEVNDTTFVSGGIGIFVNNISGFYFDELTVESIKCWTPWIPMKDIEITNPMSSVYIEDFSGTLSEKFNKVEPESPVDGPSDWRMNQFYSPDKPVGLDQRSLIYDSLQIRRPSMLILKNKIVTNGLITIGFTPSVEEGIISVVFKYLLSKTKTGQVNEEFYLFEMIPSKTNPQLALRRFTNGIVRELTSVNKKPKDLPILGFKNSVNHIVQIEIIDHNIKISMSINKSKLVEVINVKDKNISHGLIGVGTFQAKATFSRIEIFPPKLTITEEDKNKIMSTDSNELFFPPIPKFDSKTGGNNPKKITNNPGDNSQGKMRTGGDSGKLSTGKAKDNATGLGWKSCLANTSTEARVNYCERTFPIEVKRTGCKNDYCDACCRMNSSSIHQGTLHMCKKACIKATSPELSPEDYQSVCIQSINPISNIYDYCENKLSKESDKKKICKLDMCNLCCASMDQISNKLYSIQTMKNCFNECNKQFNSE